MDLPETVSLRKFRDFNENQKEELYETLLELMVAVDELPKKSLRKTLELTLAVLAYKGEQVKDLEDNRQLDNPREQERLLVENEKLKTLLAEMDDEKIEYKNKTKELTEEILGLQKRLQEAQASAEGSDKDSSDPLSELDKQETLLRNINTKNKHIKRLLKEIENLQNQNIEQSKLIICLEKDLKHDKDSEMKFKADLTLLESEKTALKESLQELNCEIKRLEGNITYLEDERERSESDLKEFVEKLEKKALSWKSMLEERDKELANLKHKKSNSDRINSTVLSSKVEQQESEGSQEQEETSKLLHSLESRDKHIEQLENKIKSMAEEMIMATKIMNNLSAEREAERNPKNSRLCCKTIEMALKASSAKCKELTEMLEKVEEECCIKSKQTLEATKALTAYQKGEDGLVKALRKCTSLEQKLQSRDKQIRALVMELNSMYEIAQENIVLRKRLNIPEDVVVLAKNHAAKERSKDKMIEKLTLKLRASEEMRLQLKMEKGDLRKEILKIKQQQQEQSSQADEITNKTDEHSLTDTEKSVERAEEKLTDNVKTKPVLNSKQSSKEVGEVEDSSNTPEMSLLVTMCSHCEDNLKVELKEDASDNEMEIKYQEIVQENNTLRQGMLDILEKLREYADTSEQIFIDKDLLCCIIRALKCSPCPNSPQKLREELNLLQLREKALEELLQKQRENEEDSDESTSIENMREDGEIKQLEIPPIDLPLPLDSSTRPTSPNQSLNIPTITNASAQQLPDVNKRLYDLEFEELKIYKKYYEELKLHMNASEMEIMQTCSKLSDQLRQLEVDLNKERSSYQYMREDYDRALTSSKQAEMKNIEREKELQIQIAQLKENCDKLQKDLSNYKTSYIYSQDDYQAIQKSHYENQILLALISEEILAGKHATQIKIPEICMDYGIIRENLQLDYISQEEYEKQKLAQSNWQQQREELQRKIIQLESLLEIAQEQIQSQQRLLNDITDNHINLRHFVADLQSTNEEKLLMAKMQRDLDAAKSEMNHLKDERDSLKQRFAALQQDFISKESLNETLKTNFHIERQNYSTKLKFLQKSLYNLKEKYAKFTPLIFLTNFIFAYNKYLQTSAEAEIKDQEEIYKNIEDIVKKIVKQENIEQEQNQQLIRLIKTETQSKLYEETIKSLESKCSDLQKDLNNLRLQQAKESEHWQTIEALFSPENMAEEGSQMRSETKTKENFKDIGCNTEGDDFIVTPKPAERKLSAQKNRKKSVELVDKNESPIHPCIMNEGTKDTATQTSVNEETDETNSKSAKSNKNNIAKASAKTTSEAEIQTTLGELQESRGIQTSEELATDQAKSGDDFKNIELENAKQKLNETQQRLEETQKDMLNLNKELQNLKQQNEDKTTETSSAKPNLQSDVIEKTILSFHTLLSEKDKSISKYQDILHTEREQNTSNVTKLNCELDGLKSTITNLNFNIKTKDIEILELKNQLECQTIRRNSVEKLDLAKNIRIPGEDENNDNSLHEMTDEKIEEMFEENPQTPIKTKQLNASDKEEESIKIPQNVIKQLKELKEQASMWESALKVKEEENALLKEKFQLLQEREKSATVANPEMDQLRELLEEKEKHINELMDTLNNFHDDHQRYINDSSNYSADQIAKLASDLNRCEATNKIYHTQVEALRKQLSNLQQREKQARELNQSLRNQLIRRPVVSIKSELNSRLKNEHLQKRVQQLELDLEDARLEIQKQRLIIESKRARSTNEIGLWEKQKKWQQSAEKFKAKLEETETHLEKTRGLLQSARNTIARLEKDKQILEAKLGRFAHQSIQQTMKCCRTPSCPNLHHQSTANSGVGVKYTPSESPETYTGASSECSSPGRTQIASSCNQTYRNLSMHNSHADIVEALKARIEMQQRKIVALELEGKGSNALTTELEKLHEKLSATEAQNIRLEAKNLQLQLDNDLLRQGDGTERLQKRIKHLEDYIIALKEEMASTEARRELCKCSGLKLNTHMGQSAEHTILSLRNLVDKLKAENKYLKDGRRSSESRSSTETVAAESNNKLQQMYKEAMNKISALQHEQQQTKCPHCTSAFTGGISNRNLDNSLLQDELKYIKEQLIKKTQLLQKAKVLLTRAAAKEKVLKEQLGMWKRKCSELQNVPVIDEISE